LLGYNYTVEYKKGKENRVADALSRVKYTLYSLFSSVAVPLWITEVKDSCDSDDKCKELITQLSVNESVVPHYTFKHGVLRYKDKLVIGSATTLRHKLIDAFHASELGGHSGSKATYQRLKLLFHWPSMKQQVVSFIQQCPVCQLNKPEHCQYPGLLQPLPIPEFAWTHVSMDFVEGLPISDNKDVILVVVDRITKYAHFVPLKHPFTVKTVAKAFKDNIFKLHGCLR